MCKCWMCGQEVDGALNDGPFERHLLDEHVKIIKNSLEVANIIVEKIERVKKVIEK